MPVIMVQLGHGAEAAMAVLKELTNPELPVAIGRLVVRLRICSCGYASSRLVDMQYVPGFAPDDPAGFRRRYALMVTRLPLATLLGPTPRPPYWHPGDVLADLLTRLGAFATVLEIKPVRDTRPCVHHP